MSSSRFKPTLKIRQGIYSLAGYFNSVELALTQVREKKQNLSAIAVLVGWVKRCLTFTQNLWNKAKSATQQAKTYKVVYP